MDWFSAEDRDIYIDGLRTKHNKIVDDFTSHVSH